MKIMSSQDLIQVKVSDIKHVKIFYDDKMYAAHPNRGGIWNFGDGEIAVAHLLKPVDYKTGEGVHHDYSRGPGGGVMLNRSFDGGETWPESERNWIWNNNRSVEEINTWLTSTSGEYEDIDMSHQDSIMHFGVTSYMRKPDTLAEELQTLITDNVSSEFIRKSAICMRSKDRGRSWEKTPGLIPIPAFIDSADKVKGNLTANLGYIKFPNGVLGIAAGAHYYVSYDQGLTWDYVSTVAYDPAGTYEYTYSGVHLLPSGRLLMSMHRLIRPLSDYPCVATSDDGGMTWSDPKYIVRPDRLPAEALPKPGKFELPVEKFNWFTKEGKPAGGWFNAYRSPCALVTKSGRIVVVFGRRRPPYGIGGVVSDDEGETWSQEFVLRDDACVADLGYPVMTELNDGRIFTAYYIAVSDSDGNIPSIRQHRGLPESAAWSAVRHVAGTSFRIA